MSRASVDQYDSTGLLINGYDYINQAWVRNGVYIACGHSEEMRCTCYVRLHAGEKPPRGDRSGAGRPIEQLVHDGSLRVNVISGTILLKEWLLFVGGFMDQRQLQELIKQSESYVQHHA